MLPRGTPRARVFASMADAAEPPEELICPITQELFVDPVVAEDGNTYSRADLLEWFSGGSAS